MILKTLTNGKLDLTNKGFLSIFFVGTGSAFSKRNFQTNPIIIKGNTTLAIDAGTRWSQALHQIGVKVTDLDHFVVTHSHADHIGGMEEVALMGRYFTHSKPHLYITEEYEKMFWEASLKGGCGYGERHHGRILHFDDFFQAHRPVLLEGYPRDTYEFNLGNLNVKLVRTMHFPETARSWKSSVWSTGLIFDDRVLFTGDTRFDPQLILDYDDHFHFETIFHDCQFFIAGVHAGLEQIKTLPLSIRKRIVPVHYGDNWEKFEPLVKEYGFQDLGRSMMYYEFR